MTVTIIPIEDNEHYSVNGHQVLKDGSANWKCDTEMSKTEKEAFWRYWKIVINNPLLTKHIKSTYKD